MLCFSGGGVGEALDSGYCDWREEVGVWVQVMVQEAGDGGEGGGEEGIGDGVVGEVVDG